MCEDQFVMADTEIACLSGGRLPGEQELTGNSREASREPESRAEMEMDALERERREQSQSRKRKRARRRRVRARKRKRLAVAGYSLLPSHHTYSIGFIHSAVSLAETAIQIYLPIRTSSSCDQ